MTPTRGGSAQAFQPSLFGATIQERFSEYDAAHPEVYGYLIALAREVRSKGFAHYGIGALWEVMRYYFQIEKEQGSDFKLNDHFRSRYARKLMAEFPDEFGDFFEIRELRSN